MDNKRWRIWVERPDGTLVARFYEAPRITEGILDQARQGLGGRIYKFSEVGSERDRRPERKSRQLENLIDPFGE